MMVSLYNAHPRTSLLCISYCFAAGDKNPETYNLSQLSPDILKCIEADSFWCLQHLLEGIQDNYTLAQPGVQSKIIALKDLIQRIDGMTCHLFPPSLSSSD